MEVCHTYIYTFKVNYHEDVLCRCAFIVCLYKSISTCLWSWLRHSNIGSVTVKQQHRFLLTIFDHASIRMIACAQRPTLMNFWRKQKQTNQITMHPVRRPLPPNPDVCRASQTERYVIYNEAGGKPLTGVHAPPFTARRVSWWALSTIGCCLPIAD